MSVAMIVNMCGEEQHCHVVLDEMLVYHMVQGPKKIDSDDDVDEAIQHPSRSETLCAIAVIKRYFVGKELLLDLMLAGFQTPQRMLRQSTSHAQRQLNLDDMLGCCKKQTLNKL